jgi:hypothetical protein
MRFAHSSAGIRTLVFHAALALAVADVGAARAQVSMSVSADNSTTYPSNLPSFPDETVTFYSSPGINGYLLFASSAVTGGKGGAVVLQTQDLQSFSLATALGYSEQVMNPPVAFGACDPSFDTEFDENYSGPGTVVQDPTLPPGNLIMIYEAENHCPGGVNQFPYYATVGLARSSDNGKTWPAPINAEFGGPNRYPVLKSSTPEPTSAENPQINLGNAIPSAFIDGNFIYIPYEFVGPPPLTPIDGSIRIARANLITDNVVVNGQSTLQFHKWNNGSFSQPGIGGLDSPVLPAGCPGIQRQPQITRNDDLGLYVMTIVCRYTNPTGQAAWYFSTATSLDLQDWTAPQLIAGSLSALTTCSSNGSSAFDGWYQSFMSPSAPQGHTLRTGKVFFLNGCQGSPARAFVYRDFTITGSPAPTTLVAAVLPASRSAQVGGRITAFATVINTGSVTGSSCSIGPASDLPTTFLYQTTNPATNGLTGSPNTPVDIPPGASQSFFIALTPSAAITPTDVRLDFACINASAAPVVIGLDTLLLSASSTPTPDVIALGATLKNDGIVHVTNGSPPSGVFAVATDNLGSGDTITVRTNTGSATLPVTVTVCQTNPSTGVCLQTPSASVVTGINTNGTPTFGFFVSASGSVAFDPANNRIFVTFTDSTNTIRGETSVAVETQ